MFKKANWIWIDKEYKADSYGEFYSEFYTQGGAKIKISCDGDYILFINGQYVSSNQYGDYEHYKSVDEIDISPYLSQDKNRLGIIVWHFGKDTQRYKKYLPGLIFEIEDKSGTILSSSENILSRESKSYISGGCVEISSQLGFSYKYDFSREDGWLLGKGDTFIKSKRVNKDCQFVARPNKRLALAPAVYGRVFSTEPLIYDLGKEYVGLLDVSLECENSANVTISYGECLKNGEVKKKIHNRRFSVDYITKAGECHHTSYMLRFACRYLQIESNSPVRVKKIGLIPQYYPVIENETTKTGIDREIYLACLNTLRLCMMEHYVDCPWREQCLYAFDSRNQMLSGYYAFKDKNLEYARSNLLLMSKDRRDDGLMSICYPCGSNLTIPSFSLYYILSVKEYLLHSRDLGFFDLVGDKLREILNTFLANERDGLICKFPKDCHWNFYDWSEHASGNLFHSEAGVCDATLSILTVLALRSYMDILSLCGKEAPNEYQNKIATLTKSIRDSYLDKDSFLFLYDKGGVPTVLVNSLAVCADLVSQEEAKVICSRLADNTLIPCSLSMKCFTYDAMIKTDKEKYRSYILDSIRRDYTPMVSSGTVWETSEGESAFDGAGSLCHGWSSLPIYYYNILHD